MKFYKRLSYGFTLTELLITVAIIGILSSVAYPSYLDYVTRNNRAEAQRELLRMANLMEQYFLDHRSYTTDMTNLGAAADPFITESTLYSIDAEMPSSGLTFVLKATAKSSQATEDSACLTLQVNNIGERTATSAHCWER